jgi:hypothetical protein
MGMPIGRQATAVALCVLAAACRTPPPTARAPIASSVPTTNVRFLEQDWSDDLRQRAYTTAQGSQMMPYAWFRALEDPASGLPFLHDDLARFGYLPNRKSAANPDGLPVGFVVDEDKTGRWIGLTCTACHTAQIHYRGTALQIDGAPTGADLTAFLGGVDQAVRKTMSDEATFDRFATKVVGTSGPSAKAKLRTDLDRFAAAWSSYVAGSTPVHAFGPGRLDAFGLIMNRVTSIDLEIPANNRLPDAPVSYPFLWDTSWHDYVQWDGAAPNRTAVNRLARNVGEVLGVFAKVEIPTDPKKPRVFYRTTARRQNLLKLELWMKDLRAPAWPEDVLGPIDPAMKARGAALYRKRCESCHQLVDPWAWMWNRQVDVKMFPVDKLGTDPTMARNNRERRADSGRLTGVVMPPPPLPGTPLEKNDLAFNIVRHVVIGAILEVPSLLHAASVPAKATNAEVKETAAELEPGYAAPVAAASLAYRARPLDGIWTTAPYLHNGSVPSLYQLLLPASKRIARFPVGSRELDPVDVGFSIAPVEGAFEFDTSLPGNRNTGHEYGTQLSEDDRRALVEFLKSL